MKLFDTILNHKKLFFVFFFFAVFLFSFFGTNVLVIKASYVDDCIQQNCGWISGMGDSYSDCVQICQNQEPPPDSAEQCSFLGGSSFMGTLATSISGGVILRGTWAAAKYINNVFLIVKNWTSLQPITKNSVFSGGWSYVRDVGNMIIVLGFVFVAISFTLRIEGYGTKKTLMNLIAIALLINFSGLLCGLMIDASKIVTDSLSTTTSGPGSLIISKLEIAGRGSLTTELCERFPWQFSAKALYYSTLYIILFITYFYLSFLFVARYTMMAFLYILSPFAFAMWALPFTKKYWSMWWENLLKWAFIGISTLFCLNITAQLLDKQIFSLSLNGMFIVLVFLFVACKLATSSSAIGASSVIGVAKGVAGFATGAISGAVVGGVVGGPGGALAGGLKGATSKGGVIGGAKAGIAQPMSSGLGHAMERIGLRKEGTTAEANSKKVNERANLLSHSYNAAMATGDTSTINRIETLARTGRGFEGAAAIKTVSDAKRLHKVFTAKDASGNYNFDPSMAAARLQYAESVGAKDLVKENEKAMPSLAEHNEVALKNLINEKDANGQYKYANNPTGISAARRELVRRKNAGMSISDRRNLDHSQINADHIDDTDHKTFARASLEYNTDQRTAAKKTVGELKKRRYDALGLQGDEAAQRAAYNVQFNRNHIEQAYSTMTPQQRQAEYNSLSATEKAAVSSVQSGSAKDYANALVDVRTKALPKDVRSKVDGLNKKISVIKKL